jgi:tripartite-type tricarboxylate transporter receptor subunit TctC
MTALRSGLAIGALLCALAAIPAAAQSFPSQAVTIVVGSQPGGTTDLLARVLAQGFSTAWGKPVVVENKVGANNQIAADFVSRSKADGLTLWVSPDSFVTNPLLNSALPPGNFAPVAGLVRGHHALAAHAALPSNTLSELIALARQKRGEINYGTSGFASAGHLSMEYLQSQAGIGFTAVHYKGATPALNDVLGGHVQLMFHDIGNVAGAANTGKLKVLGIGSATRLPAFPNVPALAESLPGFEAGAWWGLFAPRDTPPAIIAQINAQARAVLAEPGIQDQLIKAQNLTLFAGSPQDLAAHIDRERSKWQKVIQSANITVK